MVVLTPHYDGAHLFILLGIFKSASSSSSLLLLLHPTPAPTPDIQRSQMGQLFINLTAATSFPSDSSLASAPSSLNYRPAERSVALPQATLFEDAAPLVHEIRLAKEIKELTIEVAFLAVAALYTVLCVCATAVGSTLIE
ncbi:unnamed protein product [Schistocephalus solidus]|uniref:Transmembrane protein n=1 Tax=Schistocephalus solidus TaxID=70667 RepID=A0A183SX61_SCHSO|nr:unnamed protein product [Schistocephalus solidus]